MFRLFLPLSFLPLLAAAPASAAPHRLVSPAIMARVEKVHRCESPTTWRSPGPTYFGGLGWKWATWLTYRAPSFPTNMAQATPEQQAWAMAHFVAKTLHYWPDQNYPLSCDRNGY